MPRRMYNPKLTRKNRSTLSFIAVVFLVAFLLTTKFVGAIVSGTFGWDYDLMQLYAQKVMNVCIGAIFLILGSFVFAAIPVVGVVFSIIGFVVLAKQIIILLALFGFIKPSN